jgi:hypothetical protein
MSSNKETHEGSSIEVLIKGHKMVLSPSLDYAHGAFLPLKGGGSSVTIEKDATGKLKLRVDTK